MSENLILPQPGRIYRHQKGDNYKFLMHGKEEFTQADVAIYCPEKGGQVWVRPLVEFQPPRFVEVAPVQPDHSWEHFFKCSDKLPAGKGESVIVKLASGLKVTAAYDCIDHTWRCHQWDSPYCNFGQLLTEVVEWRYPAGK